MTKTFDEYCNDRGVRYWKYAEAVGVMLFYRIGELFEEKAVERSRSQIMDVIDMRPEVVNLVNEHGDVSVIDAEEAEIEIFY